MWGVTLESSICSKSHENSECSEAVGFKFDLFFCDIMKIINSNCSNEAKVVSKETFSEFPNTRKFDVYEELFFE